MAFGSRFETLFIYIFQLMNFIVSQKTGFMKFRNIMISFVVLWSFVFILSLASRTNVLFILLQLILVVLGVFLRLHMTKKYNIRGQSCFIEILYGLCCYPCSLTQSKSFTFSSFDLYHYFNFLKYYIVARHVYGYTKIFDGDADVEANMRYGGPN